MRFAFNTTVTRDLDFMIEDMHGLYHRDNKQENPVFRYIHLQHVIDQAVRFTAEIDRLQKEYLRQRHIKATVLAFAAGAGLAGGIAVAGFGATIALGGIVAACGAFSGFGLYSAFGRGWAQRLPSRLQAKFKKARGTCAFRQALAEKEQKKIIGKNLLQLAASPAIVSMLGIWKSHDLKNIFARAGIISGMRHIGQPHDVTHKPSGF